MDEAQGLRSLVQSLTQRVEVLEGKLRSPRVFFDNFEGSLKTLTTEPTASDTDWKNGTIVLTDVSGTRKLFARINNAWYSVTLT